MNPVSLVPLAMSQTKEDLLKHLNMGLDTYNLMAVSSHYLTRLQRYPHPLLPVSGPASPSPLSNIELRTNLLTGVMEYRKKQTEFTSG